MEGWFPPPIVQQRRGKASTDSLQFRPTAEKKRHTPAQKGGVCRRGFNSAPAAFFRIRRPSTRRQQPRHPSRHPQSPWPTSRPYPSPSAEKRDDFFLHYSCSCGTIIRLSMRITRGVFPAAIAFLCRNRFILNGTALVVETEHNIERIGGYCFRTVITGCFLIHHTGETPSLRRR